MSAPTTTKFPWFSPGSQSMAPPILGWCVGVMAFPGQNVPLGMSWSASAAAKRRLPA